MPRPFTLTRSNWRLQASEISRGKDTYPNSATRSSEDEWDFKEGGFAAYPEDEQGDWSHNMQTGRRLHLAKFAAYLR